MRACRIETEVAADGVIIVKDLPFKAGEQVEIIVLERNGQEAREGWRQLAGSVVRYDNPTEPVGVEDWDALR